MIQIQQLKLPITHTERDLKKQICFLLKIQEEALINWEIQRQSIDARKKKDIKYVYTLLCNVSSETKTVKQLHSPFITLIKKNSYQFPRPGADKLLYRPVIAGSGPAGLFCALILAQNGYAPILMERGERVEERTKTVQKFWDTGILSKESNVQFGEGGAGTFSDGKLNTLVKDSQGRNKKVLELFVQAGAPKEILYQQKPHLGTDVLFHITKNLRDQILEAGGEIHYNSKLTDIYQENGRLIGLELNHKQEQPADVLILAVGHSARDTFHMLYDRGLDMRQKSFAAGVRVEHRQEMINMARYGTPSHPLLGNADYKLTHKLKIRDYEDIQRGIYSFCMCPGGYVVNASSEEGLLAVNGMSYQKRDSKNANSAIVVTVTPADFASDHPLAGIEFQRKMEAAAFLCADGRIPVQLYGDFKMNRESIFIGSVKPHTKGEYALTNLRTALPSFIAESLVEGMEAFDDMIPGFAADDILLLGVESRTSSPLRIWRGESGESNIKGIYPCGEGAGYAGGITSAAMDGLKMAEAVARRFRPL